MINHALSTLASDGMSTGVLTPSDGTAVEAVVVGPTGVLFEGVHDFRESASVRAKTSVMASGGTAVGMSDEEERNERRERDMLRKDREGCLGLGSTSFGMFTYPSMNQNLVRVETSSDPDPHRPRHPAQPGYRPSSAVFG